MAISNDKRMHPRLIHRAPVRVLHSSTGRTCQLQMQDFSTGGLFINCHEAPLPEVGDELQIQTLELEDAPVLNVKVVRVIPGKGFAVEFV